MEKIIIVFFGIISGLFFTPDAFAQFGSIEGTVTDKERQESLIGTNVIIDGTTIGTITNSEGYFLLSKLEPGEYDLRFSFVSYSPVIMEKIIVEPEKTVQLKIELEEAAVGLNDVVIKAVRRTNTENAVITDIRLSPMVSIGVSAQQISRTLDKDAAEVVRRIPGITIMDERFLIVRGLSQRYNNVWMNNTSAPGSESDVRAFSFDIIPSQMIENIMIYKSAGAEIPADFSGGFVKIMTKNMPEKNSFFFNYSSSFNQGTTFNKFYGQQGSKTDWLGMGYGFRKLPGDMPDHLNLYESASNQEIKDRITEVGRKLNNNWEATPEMAIPDQKILLGKTLRFNSGNMIIGNTTTLSYSNSRDYNKVSINEYSIYNYVDDKPSYVNQLSDDQYSASVKIGLMHNWSLILDKGSRLEFRNFFNQTGSTGTIMRSGRDWYNNGRFIKSGELKYMNRSVYSGQIAGTHPFINGKTRIDWTAGYSVSDKKEPDIKRYRYIRNEQDTTQYFLLFPDNADLSSVSRTWISLKEQTISASFNISHQLKLGNFSPELRSGFFMEDKNRDLNARNFGYSKGSPDSEFDMTTLPAGEIFRNENINLLNGIRLREVTSPSDSYDATSRQIAGYISLKLPVFPRLSIYPGIRLENSLQHLFSYKQGTATEVKADRDTINIFPSINSTFKINKNSLIRLAYGKSVNRPEFREIAPFYFVDFDLNAGIYGNPEIRQAYIHNYDIRYESYPREGELFNVGFFYKEFKDPIEQRILGNSPTQYSFSNVGSSFSFGIETEVRKSLDFIKGLENFLITGNMSFIKSQVRFNPGDLERTRPMEGQSPFIINTGVYYANERKGLDISLLYNVIGKRIVAVGRPSPNQWEDIPDIYEMPRHLLDFAFSKVIGKKYEIKGGIKNLLNEKAEYVQYVNAMVDMGSYTGGADSGLQKFNRKQVTKSYFPGRYITIGFSMKL